MKNWIKYIKYSKANEVEFRYTYILKIGRLTLTYIGKGYKY